MERGGERVGCGCGLLQVGVRVMVFDQPNRVRGLRSNNTQNTTLSDKRWIRLFGFGAGR